MYSYPVQVAHSHTNKIRKSLLTDQEKMHSCQHIETTASPKEVERFTLATFIGHVIRSTLAFFQSDVNRVEVHLTGGYTLYKVPPRSESSFSENISCLVFRGIIKDGLQLMDIDFEIPEHFEASGKSVFTLESLGATPKKITEG